MPEYDLRVCVRLRRWNEVKRQLELWVCIQEMNDDGEYVDVEVDTSTPGILTGGIYMLKQGLQRRVVVSVDTVPDSGMLPLVCESITSVSIGNVVARYVVAWYGSFPLFTIDYRCEDIKKVGELRSDIVCDKVGLDSLFQKTLIIS